MTWKMCTWGWQRFVWEADIANMLSYVLYKILLCKRFQFQGIILTRQVKLFSVKTISAVELKFIYTYVIVFIKDLKKSYRTDWKGLTKNSRYFLKGFIDCNTYYSFQIVIKMDWHLPAYLFNDTKILLLLFLFVSDFYRY